MTPLVALEQVAIGYRRPLLRGISLEIGRGDRIGVVGPNGSGKTTLVRTIIGALRPLEGRVTIGFEPRRFGYVPQRGAIDELFPATVEQFVAMACWPAGPPFGTRSRAERAQARRLLARVGIEALAERPFRDLSGGQKQRALIARALAVNAPLLLLDEPTDGLDVAAAAEIDRLIATAAGEGTAIVIVSHDLERVARSVERIALIDKDRQLFEHGPVSTLLTEAHLSRLFGVPIRIDRALGHPVIEVREEAGPR